MAHLTAGNNTIAQSVHHDNYSDMRTKVLNTVRLLGLTTPPQSITVNGRSHSDFTVKPSKEVLIEGLNLPANQDFVIAYN